MHSLWWIPLLLAMGLSWWLLTPVSDDAVTPVRVVDVISPPPLKPDQKLEVLTELLKGVGVGLDVVACGPNGELYTGLSDGRILRFGPGVGYTEWVNTGGRPLGMQVDVSGRLIVADAERGLLAVDANRNIEVLVDQVFGERLVFGSDMAIAGNGDIWFSSVFKGSVDGSGQSKPAPGGGGSQLLSFSPGTGETQMHRNNLDSTVGLSFGPGDNAVLIKLHQRIDTSGLPLKRVGPYLDEGIPASTPNANGNFVNTSRVNECYGHLFLGSQTMDAVGRYAF